MRPSSASHSGPENKEERRPGTLRSRSRPSQCKPLPRPRTSTARRSLGLAPLRPEISFTGNVIVAPFVSSIRSARSWERYAAKAARGSAFAARRPAREARAKFARSSLSIQPGTRSDLRMKTERLGYRAARIVPNSPQGTKGIGLSYCSEWWAVLGSNQWPLPCETGVGCLRINDMRAGSPVATGT
jgi:hypothetical protein